MAKYVKSYSNYVLKTKHQNTSNGTIYERDITTIGGRNQFAKGQVPIYQSGNFVITVNSDNSSYKKVNNGEWYKSEYGDVWTLEVTDSFEKESTSSDDSRIEIKKDYHNLRDYAYYGSCSELIRGSIDDILKKYPGELFTPTRWIYQAADGRVQYTKDAADAAFGSGNYESIFTGLEGTYTKYVIDNEDNPGKHVAEMHVFNDTPGPSDIDQSELIVMDNPFNIDMHSRVKPLDADPLKFFADDGYKNYYIYVGNFKSEIGDYVWDFDNPYELSEPLVVFEGLGESETTETKFGFSAVSENDIRTYTEMNLCGSESDIVNVVAVKYAVNGNMLTDDELLSRVICPGDYIGYILLSGTQVHTEFDVRPTGHKHDNVDAEPFGVRVVDLNTTDTTLANFKVYMYMGDGGKIVYMVSKNASNFRIRPKESVINEFFKNLDSFQKVLLDRTTDPIFTSSFEIIDENSDGYFTYTDSFSFPTTYGGYNLGSNNVAFERYVERLSKISDFYDERFSDNLWRSMTHEAIKNFDWTFTRRFNEEDREQFTEGGQKIQKIIRLYAREFDEIKGYIDAIKDNNTVSYGNENNMPDYFFTDKLEENGWDVKPIYPLILTEYINGNLGIPYNFHTNADEVHEVENYAIIGGRKVGITRVFTQNYDLERVKPYHIDEDKVVADKTNFMISKNLLDFCNYEGSVKIDVIADGGDPCDDDTYYFNDDSEYSYVQINNEFFKRLILNSKGIMKRKGTLDSIEMMLALFHMERGVHYDIKEYTMFSPYETDKYNEVIKKYEIDYVNSTKLVTYNTEDFRNGIYRSYQGLPVSYRDVDEENHERRLYPRFQSGVEYDGGMYYQMNGGWLRKRPFIFDSKENIIPEGFDENNERSKRLFTETVRNVQTVQTISDLLSSPSLAVNSGDIVQVLDLSGRYAVVDGNTYPLIYEDTVGNYEYNYFYVTVQNGSLVVGNAVFYDNVIISNPYYTNNKQSINLSDEYYNDRQIKIYVIKAINNDTSSYSINVSSNNASISTFSVFENGKYMEGDNFTNFFRINDTYYSNELSVFGWQQMRDDEYEYFLMNAVVDDDKGNNPHNGRMQYDNGHEYLYRFNDIFNHIRVNDLIDYRQYDDTNTDLLTHLETFGFTNLVSTDICDKDYDDYLIEDTKCHYFGDFIEKDSDGNLITFKYVYDIPENSGTEGVEYYNFAKSTDGRKRVDVMTIGTWIDKIKESDEQRKTYNEFIKDEDRREYFTNDGVTDQIVNTKRLDIIFYVEGGEYSERYLEQVKYYDSVVLNYVTQLIPSSIIPCVKYVAK